MQRRRPCSRSIEASPDARAHPYADPRGPGRVPRLALALIGLLSVGALAEPITHHELRVRLEPERGLLRAEATVTLPGAADSVKIALHRGLEPTAADPRASLTPAEDGPSPPHLAHYLLRLPPGSTRFTLRYAGRIQHAVTEQATDGGRVMADTPGLIGADGVYLDPGSGWYPDTGAARIGLRLTVDLPAGWEAVSQGRRASVDAAPGRTAVRWEEDRPQDGAYLVAGRYHRWARPSPYGEAMVYLRSVDAGLAERYLDATVRYLELFSELLGPYPYAKFALVENFWETGYGMPSFTLLGPTVVRLPFIIDSSYPHEVLHSWWGNGVYIDYASGNWAEGLTSYLADHLLAELRGAAVAYRRAALQKYADYVAEAEDFPLTAFRARHGEVSQAVGYNKTLMVFHMLRRALGDRRFVQGLRRFWEDRRFRTAGWADLGAAFAAEGGTGVGDFLDQWVGRAGAPALALEGLVVERTGPGWRVRGRVVQSQPAPLYRLRVPLAVQALGKAEAEMHEVDLVDRAADFTVETAGQPVRLQVDPDFDLFRRLAPEETPPAFGRLFGAERVLFVLPASAPAALREAFRALAERWGNRRAEVVLDTETGALPSDRPAWVLGWDNRWLPEVARAVARLGGRLEAGSVTVPEGTLGRGERVVALGLPHPAGPSQVLGWVGADEAGAVAALASKLPHYGRYGRVAFAPGGLENVVKAEWALLDTPLNVALDPAGADIPVRSPPRPPLTHWRDR